jgi:hypothetical protein
MRIPYSFCVFCSGITFSASYLNVMFQNERGWMICEAAAVSLSKVWLHFVEQAK